MEKLKKIKIIDNAILVFIIIFLASLTNSIFVNQIGYYGALVLVLIKYSITKENPFSKNGLGLALILFLAAELISAILSNNHPNAFNNLLKRALLVPLLYLLPAVTDSEERGKLFIKVFLAAAFIMIGIYLVVAYEYLINKLYSVELKGPSVFKYVMTAGGIISFITIIVFAFLVNEKTKLKYKILLGVLFLMAAVSLLANYSRAAWLGGAMGIATILFVKKKYIILGIPLLLIIGYLFASPNKSFVKLYKLNDNKISEIKSVETNGRARSAYVLNNNIFVADYTNGILTLDNGNIKEKTGTESPIEKMDMWGQKYIMGYLNNSRFVLYEVLEQGKLKQLNSFLPIGRPVQTRVNNNKYYIANIDSGLTIKLNPENLNETIQLKQLNEFINFYPGEKFFVCYKTNEEALKVYNSKSGIPEKEIYSEKILTSMITLFASNKNILFQTDDGLIVYDVDSLNNIKKDKMLTNIKGISQFISDGNNIYGITVQGEILKFDSDNPFNFTKYNGKILPPSLLDSGVMIYGDTLVDAYNKRNRIGSIFDPYHNTNIERMNQWATGMRILKDNPIFGVGDIDMNPVYQKYRAPYERENFGHLHNNYVHLLAILGLFGFCVVMYLFYKVFRLNLTIYKKLKDIPFLSSYSLGVLAMFVGFLFSGLAEWNFGDHEIITLVWFLVGLNYAFYKLVNKKAVDEK